MSPRTKAKSIGFIALSLLVHSSLLASLIMSQDSTVKEAGVKGAPENGGENTMIVDLEAAGASPIEGATESAATTDLGEPKQPLLANADDEQAIPVAAPVVAPAEIKPEIKTEAKVEAKVEPKVETKPEPQPEPQPEPPKPVEKVVETPPQPKPEPIVKPKTAKKPVAKIAKPKPAPQPIVETSEELPPIETSSAPQTEETPEWMPSNEPTQEEAYREELNEESQKRNEPEPEMLSPAVVDSEPEAEAEAATAPIAAATAAGTAATNAASKPAPVEAEPAGGTTSAASAPSNVNQAANGAGKSAAGAGTGAGNGQGSGAFAGLQGSPIVEASLRRPLPGNPLPAYPQQDRLRGHEGMAVVVGKVEANGVVSEVQLERASGSALMDSAALKTFRAWKFAPDRQAALVRKSFQFSLKGDAQNAPAELRRQLGQSPNPESAKPTGL